VAQASNKSGTKSGKGKKKAEPKSVEEIKQMQEKRKSDKRVIDEIWGVILIAVGIFLFVAVQFNAAGEFGTVLGSILRGVFGLIGLVFPWYLIIFGILMLADKMIHISGKSFVLAMLILLMMCLLNSVRYIDPDNLVYKFKDFYNAGVDLSGGGIFGMSLGTLMVKTIGVSGLYILAIVVIIVCLMLVINTPISRGIENMHNKMEERRLMKNIPPEPPVAAASQTTGTSSVSPAMKQPEPQSAAPKQLAMPSIGQTAEKKPAVSVWKGTPDESTHKSGIAEIDGPHDIKIVNPYDSVSKTAVHKESDPFVDVYSKESNPNSNVLKYMTDEDPFASNNTASYHHGKSYGLEGSSASGSESGYGLDGTAASAEKGLGLDGGKASAAAGAAAGAAAAATVKKMTGKEAENAALSAEDFNNVKHKGRYKKPPIDLLNMPKNSDDPHASVDLKRSAEKLEETLKNFNVDARVVQVTQGPAVTRYEIQPNVGVKVNSIVRLADDIALNLEAKSIRIEAPIPGKAAVGIEVENDKIKMVTLREIIDSREFKAAKSKITFAVGKDIAGNAIVSDLKGMPHLLIAGSTGSGKSVCINSIITSILYKADPDEVKLVLIDPKVVELGNYNGIPHLLIPVVTEPTKAAAALNWAVAEMTDRYRKFADASVRDLESYNDKMRSDGDKEGVLPQIVIIIDELADLMMAAPSQVEESICRLAQMARAAGMHLIVATQRPSVDIITGVIKANIPSRIAFAVSSQFDSRTILDMSGAEKLVGKGDMLFNPLGMGKPIRVQGTFISDKEVHDVIEFVKSQVPDAEYSDDVMNTIDKGKTASAADDGDELMPEAVECVVKAGQASVSMLQRRFRIGYNRAARIVDEMEERGIIGPQDGSRPRQVLLTEEELEKMKEEVDS